MLCEEFWLQKTLITDRVELHLAFKRSPRNRWCGLCPQAITLVVPRLAQVNGDWSIYRSHKWEDLVRDRSEVKGESGGMRREGFRPRVRDVENHERKRLAPGGSLSSLSLTTSHSQINKAVRRLYKADPPRLVTTKPRSFFSIQDDHCAYSRTPSISDSPHRLPTKTSLTLLCLFEFASFTSGQLFLSLIPGSGNERSTQLPALMKNRSTTAKVGDGEKEGRTLPHVGCKRRRVHCIFVKDGARLSSQSTVIQKSRPPIPRSETYQRPYQSLVFGSFSCTAFRRCQPFLPLTPPATNSPPISWPSLGLPKRARCT